MAIPKLDNVKTCYDVFTCFKASAWRTTYVFRFALGRSFHLSAISNVDSSAITFTPPSGSSTVGLTGLYQGNITSISPIRNSVGAKLEAKLVYPTVTIDIARDDSEMYLSLLEAIEDTHGFGDFDVCIPLFFNRRNVSDGKSETVTTLNELLYAGIVDPKSIIVDQDSVTIQMSDVLKKYGEKDLCDTYSTDDFASMDPAYQGEAIPVIYGRHGFSAPSPVGGAGMGGNYSIMKMFPTNTGTDTYKLCTPNTQGGIEFNEDLGHSPEFYQFRTSTLVQNWGVNLRNDISGGDTTFDGIFDINAVVTWEDGDEWITVTVLPDFHGNRDSGGTVLTNPAEIWYDLLTEYAGVPTDYISSDWTTVKDLFDIGGYYAIEPRRMFTEQINIIDAIQELCSSCGMIPRIKGGKFSLGLSRLWRQSIVYFPAEITLYPVDIERGSFKFSVDLEYERASSATLYMNHDNGYSPDPDQLKAIATDLGVPIWKQYDPKFEYGSDKYFGKIAWGAEGNTIEHGLKWLYTADDWTTQKSLYADFHDPESEPYLYNVEFKVIKRLLDPDYCIGSNITINHPDIPLDDKSLNVKIYEKNDDYGKGTSHVKAYAYKEHL